MIEEFKNIKTGKKDLRNFGLIFAFLLTLIASFLLWRGRDNAEILFIISAVFLLSSLALPKILIPIYKPWMFIALAIGWFITRIIIIVLFYVVVTPIGVIMRLVKKDFLSLEFNDNIDSYWVRKKIVKFDKSKYENQY